MHLQCHLLMQENKFKYIVVIGRSSKVQKVDISMQAIDALKDDKPFMPAILHLITSLCINARSAAFEVQCHGNLHLQCWTVRSIHLPPDGRSPWEPPLAHMRDVVTAGELGQ